MDLHSIAWCGAWTSACARSVVAPRVRELAGPAVPVIIDDQALNQRAIQMLRAILAHQDGDRPVRPAAPRPEAARSSSILGRPRHGAPRGRRRRGSHATEP